MHLARQEFYAAGGSPTTNHLIRLPSAWKLALLLCTSCGKLKRRSDFVDSQASKKTMRMAIRGVEGFPGHHYSYGTSPRVCIACSPISGRKVTVRGREIFVCCKCRKPHDLQECVLVRMGASKSFAWTMRVPETLKPRKVDMLCMMT